eukprot:scaffold315_cov101-Isochrysis_galbana.AAC.6
MSALTAAPHPNPTHWLEHLAVHAGRRALCSPRGALALGKSSGTAEQSGLGGRFFFCARLSSPSLETSPRLWCSCSSSGSALWRLRRKHSSTEGVR